MALGGFSSDAAEAHGGLLVGVPGPGQRSGGDIEVLQLYFAEPLVSGTVAVEDPDGSVIAGSLDHVTPDLLEYTVDALTVEGPYTVRYQVLFEDEITFESAYQFTYDSSQPAAMPIEVANRPGGRSWVRTGAVVVLVVAVVGLALLLLWRLRELRSARAR